MPVRSATAAPAAKYSLANPTVVSNGGYVVIYLSRDRTTFYATSAVSSVHRVLNKSTDGGATWTTIRTLSLPDNTRSIIGMVELPNGEILLAMSGLAAGGAQVYKSSGWVANPATATLTLVNTQLGGTILAHYCLHDQAVGSNGVVVLAEGGTQTASTGITYTNKGTGYTTATLEGVGGTGAVIQAFLLNGVIERVAVINGGSGYTAGNFTITGDGSGAVIGYTVTGGVINGVTTNAARRVWISQDFGDTWSMAWDVYVSPDYKYGTGLHIHGVSYDHEWDRIWVLFGDNTGAGTNVAGTGNAQIAYSDDRGATWSFLSELAIFSSGFTGSSAAQYTAIRATRYGLLLGADAMWNVGVVVIPRVGYRQLGEAFFSGGSDFDNAGVFRIFRSAYGTDDSLPMFIAAEQSTTASTTGKEVAILAVSNHGYTCEEFWRDPDLTARPLVTGYQPQEFYGPDTAGRLIANYTQNGGANLHVRGELVTN